MPGYGMRRWDSRRGPAPLSRQVIPLHGIVPQNWGPYAMPQKTCRIAKADQTLTTGFQHPIPPATLCNPWPFPAGNSAKYTRAPGHLAALTADPALPFSARGEAAQHRARP